MPGSVVVIVIVAPTSLGAGPILEALLCEHHGGPRVRGLAFQNWREIFRREF
jgi:hypothetical protein